jgi:hypothetical protein
MHKPTGKGGSFSKVPNYNCYRPEIDEKNGIDEIQAEILTFFFFSIRPFNMLVNVVRAVIDVSTFDSCYRFQIE